ncbi:cartilage intermediate layer protein 1-like [Mizuhopecten yessoensis]|uniref:cartilage intermediate layer protein 1-like n=1 Tax=Mizuhopecten yessoensis TaxID=6573 RepID=UPI000B45C2A2|nr:cartilage intermediate layer protein 1-like [Mizuhopecten yessoensis]
MDTKGNKKLGPLSVFMKLQRKRSDVYQIAAKPVSSTSRLKTFLIVATVSTDICLVVAISVAMALTINSPDMVNKNNPPLGKLGKTIASTMSTTASPATTTASPTTTTASPATVTASPATTTASPATSTASSATMTASPTTSTASPATVTASPTTTTASPTTTTASPATVTASPATATASPTTTIASPITTPATSTASSATTTASSTTTGPPLSSSTQNTGGGVETTAVSTSGLETTTPATAPGTWNNWGSWTSCGAICGTGYHTRYRTCLRTSASDPICQGEYVETTTCSVAICPVYGVWTTWSGWVVCDVTCGGGTQLRTRVCQKSSSSDLDCVGSPSQSQTCNTWGCPDCSQTCTTGVLNADCTACECTSNTVQGIVRNHVNVPLHEASIAHASVPYKTLATTSETGGFVLDTTCEAVEVVVTKAGYADVTVVVTGTTVTIKMSLTEYPAISLNPKSRVRVQGENVTFCCEAYGNPAITSYEWMKDGVLIDDTKYLDGYNLTLNDVTINDSGEYKCRANSPVGAVYSASGLLTVKSTKAEFCEDAYKERKISLPSDCVQADNTNLYEVGGCAKKTCRSSNNEDGLCGPTKKFCCKPSSEEERTIQCSDYTLQVIVVTGCSCGECSSADIRVQGQVNGLNTGVALRLGTIYVNGASVARTTSSGVFSFTLPTGTLSVALTIEDTIFKTLLTTTRLLTFDESMEGAVDQKITLMEAAPRISIASDVKNTLSMGNSSGMPAIAEMTIPPNSYVDASGNLYNGVVKASVNIFDPRNLSSISTAPGSFEFIDAEGDIQDLQTFGVVVLDVQDESGNKLNVAGNVTIKLDAALVESTYSGNVTDAKLWGLNTVTGQWEEVGSMVVETSKRRKRQIVRKYLVGQVSISAFQAINLDCYRGFNRCYFKTTVTDTNNNPVNGYTVRVMHMTYPGEKYGSASEYVTAVKEMSSDSGSSQYTFCRSDAWGYIQAYKRAEVYNPGVSSASGLSATAGSRLNYQTTTNPVRIKAKFLISDDGPFIHRSRLSSIKETQNQFRFYQSSSVNSYPEFTLIPLSVGPTEAFSMSIPAYAADLGPMLWYPYKNPTTLSEFQICMIKIAVDVQTSGLSFLVKSKAGPNSGIADTILGVRNVAVENGGACIEYKCSGPFPLFKNVLTGTSPYNRHDYTKVTITPVNRFCTVSWEGDIKLHPLNAGFNNLGSVSHEWFIPNTEEYGIYMYEQTESYETIDWDDTRQTTLNMCKEGVKSPSGTVNPSMNAVDPALKFTCK